MAHESSAAASTDLDRRIAEQPSTICRRAAARASLRSQGKFHGLTMTRNKEIPVCSNGEMDVPPGQLFVSWLEANRNIPASASRQGETALKNAKEFVGASKGFRLLFNH
jgi:hypothetical protein